VADYRFIKCRFWSDPYVRNLPSEFRTIYIWMFTNEHSNQAGLYYITEDTISLETGYPIDKVSAAVDKLSADKKIFFTPEKLLWVKNFIRHQPSKSPKVLKRIAKDLKELNRNKLIGQLLKYNKEFKIPYRYVIDTLSPDGAKEKKRKEKNINNNSPQGLPPIPKNFPFKTQDDLKARLAEIRQLHRKLHDKEYLKKFPASRNDFLCKLQQKEKKYRELIEDFS
jgi:hypothetical protein